MHQQLAGNGPKLRNTAMPPESLALRQGETLPLPSETLKIEDNPWLCCLNEVGVRTTVSKVEPGKRPTGSFLELGTGTKQAQEHRVGLTWKHASEL